MWYAGIDLHRRTAVVAMVDDDKKQESAARYEDCYDPDRQVTSLAEFLGDLLLNEGTFEHGSLEERRRAARRLRKLITQHILGPLEEPFQDDEKADEEPEDFVVPGSPGEVAAASPFPEDVVKWIRAGGSLFPHDSWPRVLARMVVFVSCGRLEYANRDLQQLYRSENVGPVGNLLIASVVKYLSPNLALAFADKGLKEFSLEGYHKDCRLLLDSDFFKDIPAIVVKAARLLDQESVGIFAAVLAPQEAEAFKAFMNLLEERKDAEASEIFSQALALLWVTFLGDCAAKELRAMLPTR